MNGRCQFTSARYPVRIVANTKITFVIAELRPNCFVRYTPVKKREIKPVESGTINPEPIPKSALTAISCHIFVESKYRIPLNEKTTRPTCSRRILLIFSVSLPDRMIKGMISREGSDESICMSSSVECGKIAESFPKIGETARPGNAFSADIDHIPISVIRGIVPCPVCIRIIVLFIVLKQSRIANVHFWTSSTYKILLQSRFRLKYK